MTAKHATIHRLVSVVLFLHRATEPLTVAEIADLCDCEVETTRNYLAEMVAQGVVERAGYPVQYRWAQ